MANLLKKLTNVTGDLAGDAARKAGKTGTNKLGKEAMEKLNKSFGDKLGDKAAKELKDKALKEAQEKTAKEIAQKADDAAAEAAEKAAKEGLDEAGQKLAAKQAREAAEDKARKEALEELSDDDIAKKLGEEGSETVGKNRKIMDWMKKNPGKTVAAAGVAVFGATLLGLGIDRFAENNNKPLTIVKMEDVDKVTDKPLTDFTATNDKVLITFDPSTKLADGDKIEVADTNMEPNFKGKEFSVDEIVSDTQIKVTFKEIKKYASNGTVILKTTFDNCIAQTSKETGETITEGVSSITGGVMDTLFDGPLKPLKEFYEKSKKIINIACFACCYLICMGIVYKVFRMFR